jgi:hypothetical protein
MNFLQSVVLERDNNIAETDFVEADIPSGIFELKEFGPPGYADFGRELYAVRTVLSTMRSKVFRF